MKIIKKCARMYQIYLSIFIYKFQRQTYCFFILSCIHQVFNDLIVNNVNAFVNYHDFDVLFQIIIFLDYHQENL